MRNKCGFTVNERINKDLELAEMTSDAEHRNMLAHTAIAVAEFAVDFGLISYREWDEFTRRAFSCL